MKTEESFVTGDAGRTDELRPVMDALPYRRDEVQLTSVLAAFARDPVFACSFANLALDTARREHGLAGEHARTVSELTGAVHCKSEERIAVGADGGRCDLLFESHGLRTPA
ncbi:MAG: hypothetical protein ACYC6M_11525 [Terriglobales bacterium]